MKVPNEIIIALGQKKAAAYANIELGKLNKKLDKIINANQIINLHL